MWHQFEKATAPGKIWCEVLDEDLHKFEETGCKIVTDLPKLPDWIPSEMKDAMHDYAHLAMQPLMAEKEAFRLQYEAACKLVADMHRAAMGGSVGPVLGVVEDVAALRDDAERYRWLRAASIVSWVTPLIMLPEYDNGVFRGTYRLLTGSEADKLVDEVRGCAQPEGEQQL